MLPSLLDIAIVISLSKWGLDTGPLCSAELYYHCINALRRPTYPLQCRVQCEVRCPPNALHLIYCPSTGILPPSPHSANTALALCEALRRERGCVAWLHTSLQGQRNGRMGALWRVMEEHRERGRAHISLTSGSDGG
ncbi:hypothetical protein M3J09_007663 [Ascochyta lentis]